MHSKAAQEFAAMLPALQAHCDAESLVFRSLQLPPNSVLQPCTAGHLTTICSADPFAPPAQLPAGTMS